MNQLFLILCLTCIFISGCAVNNSKDVPVDNKPVRDAIYSQLKKNGVEFFSYVPQFEIVPDLKMSAMVISERDSDGFYATSLYFRYGDGTEVFADATIGALNGFINAEWLILEQFCDPVLITSWSIGSHSQSLRIFTPGKDREVDLIYSKNGAYFVSYSEIDGKLEVEYDEYGDGQDMVQKSELWPAGVEKQECFGR